MKTVSRRYALKLGLAGLVTLALANRTGKSGLSSEQIEESDYSTLNPHPQNTAQPFKHKPTTPTGGKEHRILCLDGGGSISAYFEVMTLIDIFGKETRGRDVLKNFDEVYAVSSGGILCAGLITDYRLDDIRKMLECEHFYKGIYAAKNKKIEPKSEATKKENKKPARFKRNPAKGMTYFRKATMWFVEAMSEICNLKAFSTEGKIKYLSAAIDHNVPAEHSSARDVPVMADRAQVGLSAMTFDKIPDLIGLNHNGEKIKIHYLCEGSDKGLVIASTENEPVAADKLRGLEVTQILGKDAPFGLVVSASANPGVVFYDNPVVLNGVECWDGGMTGNNTPVALAIEATLKKGINAADIRILNPGISPRLKDYWALHTIYKMKVHLARPWDEHLEGTQVQGLQEAYAMLPEPNQIMRIAPAFSDPEAPIMTMSSLAKEPSEINTIRQTCDEWRRGRIPDQVIQMPDGKRLGCSSRKKAVAKVREWLFGSEQHAFSFRRAFSRTQAHPRQAPA